MNLCLIAKTPSQLENRNIIVSSIANKHSRSQSDMSKRAISCFLILEYRQNLLAKLQTRLSSWQSYWSICNIAQFSRYLNDIVEISSSILLCYCEFRLANLSSTFNEVLSELKFNLVEARIAINLTASAVASSPIDAMIGCLWSNCKCSLDLFRFVFGCIVILLDLHVF